MVERIVISPPPGSRLGSPEVRPTGRINFTPRQEQVIKGQEEERARQAQLQNLASRYNNRFNPELRAAIAAQQELGRNSTAAADYITQIGMERRKEEIQRGLLGADQPNGLAGKSTDVGAGIAQDRNTIGSLSGLLGDIDYKGILNQLVKTFQRPEMLTPGVNALTAFGMSGAALNQAEMAGAAAEQERMDKFAIEQLKNAGPKEFKGPMIKSIEKAAATRQSLDAINTYLELLSNKRIGGVGAKTEEGVKAIGALFGAGGESGAATARSIRSQIITGLQMGVSQGQISQGDYEQLNNILSADGWFVSNEKVESQLQRLKGVLSGKLATTTKILEAQGIDPSRFSPDAPSGLVSARRPAQ